MNQLLRYLNKPFPREERFADAVKIITAISVFVAVFLYVFRPFGLHTVKLNYLPLCLGFGATTFVVSLVYEWFVVYVIRFKQQGATFTFGRWLVYMGGAMLLISVANFLLVRVFVIGSIDWTLLPYMIRGTFAIGLFPMIAFGGWALLSQERKHRDVASALNEAQRAPTTGEQGDASDQAQRLFGIEMSAVRYIEAMQNYVNVVYLDEHNVVKERIERATLKSLENDHPSVSLVRCHRSFLVNRDAIERSSGNAQGLQLELKHCGGSRIVPVSRRYVRAFR